MRLFGFGCIHNWEVLDKTEMPNAFEQMQKAGLKKFSGDRPDTIKLFKKKVIVVLHCKKCPVTKVIVESNP